MALDVVSMPPRRSCFEEGWADGLCFECTFQCHHGVPASGPIRQTLPYPTWVSMPPRRSCFPTSPGRRPGATPVSMPPRRSCFVANSSRSTQGGLVSMPPRRSCFSAIAPIPRGAIRLVSMPPRRSCFGFRGGFRPGSRRFQCHHGVPASTMPSARSSPRSAYFNATTAFLLRRRCSRACGPSPIFQCHHGVPASAGGGRAAPGAAGFQCHHGVPASSRSGLPGGINLYFNATTAFLLPPAAPTPRPPPADFNATTAFLLQPSQPPLGMR